MWIPFRAIWFAMAILATPFPMPSKMKLDVLEMHLKELIQGAWVRSIGLHEYSACRWALRFRPANIL